MCGPSLAVDDTSYSGVLNSWIWKEWPYCPVFLPLAVKRMLAYPRFGVLGRTKRASKPPSGLTSVLPLVISFPRGPVTT